jgi:hypothetical protein
MNYLRQRTRLVILATASVLAVPVSVVPTFSHVWSDYCSSTSLSLLNVYQDENSGGSTDHACFLSDDEWGDSSGEIRNFHDKLTSYHIRDRSDSNGRRTCIIFFRDPSHNGEYMYSSDQQSIADGSHFIESNVGSYWNDSFDSHTTAYTTASVCPP